MRAHYKEESSNSQGQLWVLQEWAQRHREETTEPERDQLITNDLSGYGLVIHPLSAFVFLFLKMQCQKSFEGLLSDLKF